MIASPARSRLARSVGDEGGARFTVRIEDADFGDAVVGDSLLPTRLPQQAPGVKTEGARWFPPEDGLAAALVFHSSVVAPADSSWPDRGATRVISGRRGCRPVKPRAARSSRPRPRHPSEGQRADGGNRPGGPEHVGHDAGGERPDRVAHVAPETVDAEERARQDGCEASETAAMSVG